MYEFSHLAGSTGGPGFADGPASDARFNSPTGVAFDAAGNLYVTDQRNRAIRKIAPDGTVSTVVGNPATTAPYDGDLSTARFGSPRAIAVGEDGIYLTDSNTVRRVENGQVTTLAGTYLENPVGYEEGVGARLGFLHGIAVEASGNVLVSEYSSHVVRRITPGGFVSTAAGTYGVYGGDDGPAQFATLGLPKGLAGDATGALLISSGLNGSIRRLTAAGTVSSFVNGLFLPSTPGVTDPDAMAVAANGEVYVTQSGLHNVLKLNADGGVAWTAGQAGQRGFADGAAAQARFQTPSGIAVDSEGIAYVADSGNHLIRRIAPDGTVSVFAGGGPALRGSANAVGTAARFASPAAVAVDAAGNVYVGDSDNHSIRKISPTGQVTTFYQSPDSEVFRGLAADAQGNLWATSSRHVVLKIAADGEATTVAGSRNQSGSVDGAGTLARFTSPWPLALDTAGNVYVADNSTVRKITPAGEVTTVAGKGGILGVEDGAGPDARFTLPYGLAVDASGTVYVADSSNGTIRRISSTGVVTTIAGSAREYGFVDGTGAAARFNSPRGMALESDGNLLVADNGYGAIRRVTPAGVVTTVAGALGREGATDGPGPVASFYFPNGIALDNRGNLYVADAGNHAVRKGSLVTVAAGSAAQGPAVDSTFEIRGVVSDSAASHRWHRNGRVLETAGATLSIQDVQPSDAGLYQVASAQAPAILSRPVVLGFTTTNKVEGDAREIGPNIEHPNTKIYDQLLLEGRAAAFTADNNQVTRLSFTDLTGDIVQVEFTGRGTLTIVADAVSAPAVASNYNQPQIAYVTGHPGIVITGADESTNVTVFTVGRITALNPALFKDEVDYDGFADIAYIAIESANGLFGGLRAANVNFYATAGVTGVYAPNVEFRGPVYVGDITAFDTAMPVLMLGGATTDTWITGGDLQQANGAVVRVSGIGRLEFKAGTTSHGGSLSAQPNRGILERDGVDVTAAIAVNP